MTTPSDNSPGASSLLDRSDERLKDRSGVVGALKSFLDRVRAGDLGSLPVVVGLVVICTIFQTLNPVFLSPNNLVNLLFDCSTVGVISLGIVCVLMVGEIDLSVGSVSGLSSAILGVLWVQMGWPAGLAVLAALAVGFAIGCVYALLFNGSACRVLCRRFPACSPFWDCSSTFWARPALSICPTVPRW
jgi:D-xylose transport system permease protein